MVFVRCIELSGKHMNIKTQPGVSLDKYIVEAQNFFYQNSFLPKKNSNFFLTKFFLTIFFYQQRGLYWPVFIGHCPYKMHDTIIGFSLVDFNETWNEHIDLYGAIEAVHWENIN